MAEIKTDCFGYNCRKNECAILTETVCEHRTCSFYKTQEQYEEDKKKYDVKKHKTIEHTRKCGACGERFEENQMIRRKESPNGWFCWECYKGGTK